MNAIIGLLVVFASVIGGFIWAGGHPGVLWQSYKMLIIVGAAVGAMIVSIGIKGVLHVAKDTLGLMKGNAYTKERYAELLEFLFSLFQIARKDGNVALESHVEDPQNSELFKRYPSVLADEDAVLFLSDTIKVLITGAINPYDLDAALDLDLERYEEEAHHSSHALQATGDAMPGFGIVAAVLGVVLTMGAVGGDPAVIGAKIAAALVGTLLGVLFAYGVFGPLAQATGAVAKSKMAYLYAIKSALLTFVKGDSPLTCVEFARRNIEPGSRPSFLELEQRTRKAREQSG